MAIYSLQRFVPEDDYMYIHLKNTLKSWERPGEKTTHSGESLR